MLHRKSYPVREGAAYSLAQLLREKAVPILVPRLKVEAGYDYEGLVLALSICGKDGARWSSYYDAKWRNAVDNKW